MFRISNLDRHLTMGVADNFKLKKVKYFTKKKNEHKFENKGICGIILHCKSPTTSSRVVSTYNANKRGKTGYQQSKSYHRWFLCADLSNPPHTFVIITHSHQQTCDLLTHVHDKPFMGMPFYLVEPKLSTGRLGDYLHLLEHRGEKLFPLRTNARLLKTEAPLELPNGSTDQTFYFVLEAESISLTMMNYSMNTCTGYQCDRHWGKDGCVCAFGSMGNALVYEFSFRLNVDKEHFETDTHIATLNSFRTMSVFFHNLQEYTNITTGVKEEKYKLRRRSQVRRLISFINANGGWKIIGWCKRGMLSVDGDPEKVENREVNLNLTYVYPQDHNIFNNPIFKALQIRDDFDILDHQLPNLSQETSSSDSSDSDSDSDSDDDGPHLHHHRNYHHGYDDSATEEENEFVGVDLDGNCLTDMPVAELVDSDEYSED